ncbi:MAG: hypothetical protein DMG57_32755 [Acidobacteria bacterium]|nr:MAG: hypothetical protein DMG57_32755 [Acidobacteriota bacterium]
MQERGVSRELALQILENAIPFRYVHGGSQKQGYYDDQRRVIVSVAGDTVTTVILCVSEQHIEGLRKKIV